MSREQLLTADRLRELLRYEPETGNFIRLVKTGGRYGANVGTVAGTKTSEGRVFVSVQSKQYRAHRLAWLYMTGEWPKGEIDHINGEPSDNRWANLRDVSRRVNAQNLRRAHSHSGTGLLGASWGSRDRRFVARIKHQGKYVSLGGFDTAEEAHAAYVAAKRRLHEGCTI